MSGPPDDMTIGDDAMVIRRVSAKQQFFDENTGSRRPASMAFRQNGIAGDVSVYLMLETTFDAVAAGGSQPYLCVVSVGVLRQNGLGIIRTPESGGPGHCDITGRKTTGRLRRIARQAQWVPGYAPPAGADDVP